MYCTRKDIKLSDYKLIRLARCSSADGFIQNYCLNDLDKNRIKEINCILDEIKEYSNKFRLLDENKQQEIINKIIINHKNNSDLCKKVFHILLNDPIYYNPVTYGLSDKKILVKRK